jgi:hypothetical protein
MVNQTGLARSCSTMQDSAEHNLERPAGNLDDAENNV